jgi:hypothetical protein
MSSTGEIEPNSLNVWGSDDEAAEVRGPTSRAGGEADKLEGANQCLLKNKRTKSIDGL